MKSLWMLLGALSIVGMISYAACLYLVWRTMKGFWLRFCLVSLFAYIAIGQLMTVTHLSGLWTIQPIPIFTLRALVALNGPLLLLTLLGIFKNGHKK